MYDFRENIVNYIPSGLLVLDKGLRIVLANRSYCEIFNTSTVDIEGKILKDIMPKDGLEIKLERVDTGRNPLCGLELRYPLPKTGDKNLHISISETPLPNVNGEEMGLLIVIQDFTYRKRLEEELIQSQKMAALGETAARVAHELRNPLQKVSIGVQYLQKHSPVGDKENGVIDGIIDGVNSINRIATDLLDYTRPLKLTCHDVDIHNVIDGVLFETEGDFNKLNIRITKQYDKNIRRIWADGFKIKHALQNIVKNAIDAMPRGGELTLTTSLKKHKGKKFKDVFEIEISDTGCGIPPWEVRKVFQPFHTTKEKGIGLGMSIAKNMIDLHEGEILFESKVEEGTRVIIRLFIK